MTNIQYPGPIETKIIITSVGIARLPAFDQAAIQRLVAEAEEPLILDSPYGPELDSGTVNYRGFGHDLWVFWTCSVYQDETLSGRVINRASCFTVLHIMLWRENPRLYRLGSLRRFFSDVQQHGWLYCYWPWSVRLAVLFLALTVSLAVAFLIGPDRQWQNCLLE